MASLIVPRGQLIAWGTFPFVAGRSKPLQGWEMTSPVSHRVVAGALFSVDGYAGGVAPVDYLLPYEYLIACRSGGRVADVQDQLDALTRLWGTAQRQLLTIYRLGTSDVVSGQARIERMNEVEGQPTRVRLNITFYVEGGMYTV